MALTAPQIVEGLWIFFAVFWLVASLSVNKMRQRESLGGRLSYVLIPALGICVLYQLDVPFGLLRRRFMQPEPWVGTLGVCLTALGIALAIWARVHIGKYWSGSVSLREGHQLIRTGPYRRIRHPIYSGLLVAFAGTFLMRGRYVDMAAFGLVILALTVKARKEEALLSGEFGPAFEEHRRHTGFFLPRLSE